jgi:ketol-acid reductoisomerase
MLVGYNTNVKYKGNVYHVQTEDNGLRNPTIVTLLYIKGTILSSKKVSYEHLANSPDYKETVRELMKKQHKNMLKELISGKYTAGDTPEPSDETSTLEKNKEPQQESQTKCKITKSLDDVLLDYIIKKEDQ